MLALVAPSVMPAEPDKLLPADTDAVVTVNLKALLDAPAIKTHALAEIKKGFEQNVHVAVVLSLAGLDPFKDLDRITLAIVKPHEPAVLVIVRGRFNMAQFQGVLDSGVKLDPKKYAVAEYRSIKVYQGKDGYGWYGALLDKKTLVISQQDVMVKNAIDQSLAKTPTKLSKELAASLAKVDEKQSIWFALAATKAVKDAVRSHPDGKHIADKLQGTIGGLTVSEGIRLDLTLFTTDPAAMKQMKAELDEGMKALMTFASAPDFGPLVVDVLNGTSVTVDAGTLRFRVDLSGKTIANLIKLGRQQDAP